MEGLFSLKHVVGLIWIFLFVVIMLFLTLVILKNHDKKTVVKIGAVFLILLEIIKDIYLIKRDGTLQDRYIPLQFSSLFIYAIPIIAFCKGKIVSFVKPFAFAGGLIASLLALFLPTNILGNIHIWWLDQRNFIYTLSFLYHGWVLFVSLYLVLSGYYIPKKHDIWKVVVISIFFVVIAFILNVILHTDLMMLNKGNGNPLKFVLHDYGFIVYVLVQFVIMIIILYLIFLPFKFIYKEK